MNMEQKLIRIANANFSPVQALLTEGWKVKEISSCALDVHTYCYCLLERVPLKDGNIICD